MFMVVKQIKEIERAEPKFYIPVGRFGLRNRRFLGSKSKLLGFIEDIVKEKCPNLNSFCDIFAGTGVVGERLSSRKIKVIVNDLLFSNYVPLRAFFGISNFDSESIEEKITYLNNLKVKKENYFSLHYGGTYFTKDNARKIGAIREEIEKIARNKDEAYILLTSLLYATDKVANTVGHYDAYREELDVVQSLQLLIPNIKHTQNIENEIYHEDANELIRKIYCDVLYMDPPYNSRQYSDTYHLLENLTKWEKPVLFGKAKKMNRTTLKSRYSLKSAPQAFADLISNAQCKHILISYNSTGDSKHGRSNARISDSEIMNALKKRGDVEIFKRVHKAFTAGKSDSTGNIERVFYCKVTKG